MGLIAPSIQNFPKPGIEPVFPALLGRFLSTLTPGKAQSTLDLKKFLSPFHLSMGFICQTLLDVSQVGFINNSVVCPLFVDGLPMKKNILKASSSCLKKEILKTVMPLGH